MNAVIEALYTEKRAQTPHGDWVPLDESVMPKTHGEMLYHLTRAHGPEAHTLEIGMAFALSTLYFCQAHKENGRGLHVAIDPYQEASWYGAGRESVKRAGLEEYLSLIEERSFISLPQLLAEDRKFHVAFIDGNHRFEHTFLDFFYIDRMLHAGGHLVLHDVNFPSVRKVMSLCLALHGEFYSIDRTFMDPPANLFTLLRLSMHRLRQAPLDLSTAYRMRRESREECMVLKKIAHRPDSDYDLRWKEYRPF
ncbi:MAG: class I SAM-dependent methyltransferase [Candidatus Hydrogenedentes bacterium]|nr:class I SAM-dependent methyltransferase [Candidatus Hydrogenedentota bacterium]